MESNHSFIENQEESLNLRELFDKYIYHWKWFLLAIVLTIIGALIYLNYATPVYQTNASVLIKEDNKAGAIGNLSVLKDLFGGIGGVSGDVDNEIEIFKSHSLIKQVVINLNLNITFFSNNNSLIPSSVIENPPVFLERSLSDSAFYELDTTLSIKIVGLNEFVLITDKGNTQKKYSFNTQIPSPLNFSLQKNTFFQKDWIGKEIEIVIIPVHKAIKNLQEKLKVELVKKDANIISLSLKGTNIKINQAILNELINQHKLAAITDKNEVASITSKFINDRMKLIVSELADVESEGEQYKSKNKLVDVASDAAVYLKKESETDKALTEANIQLSLADFLNEYVKKHTGFDDLLPANLGLTDQSVVVMTTQFNQLVLERKRLLQNSSEKNPLIQKIEGQLSGLKISLVESLKNLKSILQLQINNLATKESQYQSKIASIPQYEREYRNIMRQQQIKETLYLFLLQKREENEITLAASVADTKVVDYAYTDREPVAPKKKVILLGAILLGLILPASCIYIKDLLDNKVHTRKDIEKLGLPYLGDIPKANVLANSKVVVGNGVRTGIAEAYRLLRTNINFMLDANAENGKLIFVTSTVAKEGKSFNSLNIAHTFALSGKKTLLIGLDLRSPTLLKYMGINSSKMGISNYISDVDLHIEDILQKDDTNPNIFFISSGVIPPNPSELLMRKRLDDLFDSLKKQFDYIIIDTAPIALVTDTLLIASKSDVIIYVVRANMLDKRMLEIPQNLYRDKRLPNMAVLLNATDIEGNGYGYGYGHGTPEKKTFLQKLFNKS